MLLPKRVKVSLVALVVAGGAVAAAALGPAGLAVGQSSPPTVGQSSPPLELQLAVKSPATLVANGAGVDVPVTASCSGQFAVSGSVSIIDLTEHVGNLLASGASPPSYSASTGAFDCAAGTEQTIELLVIAYPAVKAFDRGSAVAQVILGACEVNGPCASQTLEPTIKIK
jgi:hypothetical protein